MQIFEWGPQIGFKQSLVSFRMFRHGIYASCFYYDSAWGNKLFL